MFFFSVEMDFNVSDTTMSTADIEFTCTGISTICDNIASSVMLYLTLHPSNEIVAVEGESHDCSVRSARFEGLQCSTTYTVTAALKLSGKLQTDCILRTSSISTKSCGMYIINNTRVPCASL